MQPAAAEKNTSVIAGASLTDEDESEAAEVGAAAAPEHLAALKPSKALEGETKLPDAVSESAAASPAKATPHARPAGPAPRILFSNRPAVLVRVDGAPRFVPVKGTALTRIANTDAIVLKGKHGRFYLPVYDGFMSAPELSGPWTVVKSPPKVLGQAKAAAVAAGQHDLFSSSGASIRLAAANAPHVYVSTRPAELVVIQGDPSYREVPGTAFARLVNTQSHVFRDRQDGSIYVQGRQAWYRAPAFNGPWEAVADSELPDGVQQVSEGQSKQ